MARIHKLRKRGEDSALNRAWKATVARERDRVALIEAGSGSRYSFRELEARATAWANRHAPDAKAWKGRAVVFAVPNGIQWFDVFLGLIRLGAVAVPLDASEPENAQLEHVRSLRAAGRLSGGELLRYDQARRFRGDVALIKMTSGSTGRPRSLVFTGAQLLADGRQVMATMGIRRTDLNYALIPFGHSYGLGNLTLPLISRGVAVVCGSSALPHAIANDFASHHPTVFPGVPAFWRALAATDVPMDAFRSLRLAISAGAQLPAEVARGFAARFPCPLHNFYGSSETGGIAYDRRGAATLEGSVGTAMRGVRWRITGERVAVSSAAVFTYGNRLRNGAHGTWKMPDRVGKNERGELSLLGRTGKLVKIGGRRLNVAEVVARLRRLSGVIDAWVAPSEGAEPTLGAVVISDRPVTELRTELQIDLPAWKVPKKWATVAEWPLTERGKIDTRALYGLLFRR